MLKTRGKETSGFTLLELTIAMAVFAILMAGTAQALISFYAAMHLQEQRHAAAEAAQSVLSDMRVVRDANPGNFPAAIVAQWPDGEDVTPVASLPGETITVDYADTTNNPLTISVRVQWNDLRGRVVSESVSTMLTGV